MTSQLLLTIEVVAFALMIMLVGLGDMLDRLGESEAALETS
jgi:hypothetical protein